MKVEEVTGQSGTAEPGTVVSQSERAVEVNQPTVAVIGDHAQVTINAPAPPAPPAQPYHLAPHVPPQEVKGRSGALASLMQLLKPGAPSDRRAVALWGVGGIGKTTLVQHLAHSPTCAEIFPDGHLWVELGRDYDPANLAATLHNLAARMHIKTAENWSAEQYKQSLQDQLAGRKVLLVIDDVWEAVHAAWGKEICGESCGIVYTTRRREVAIDLVGNRTPVEVDVLESGAALELLAAQLAAPLDITHFPEADIRELCQIIGYLPLGLKLAGRFLSKHSRGTGPGRPQPALQRLIRQRQARLDLLLQEMRRGGARQGGATIRDILQLSLRDYTDQDQQNFAVLSIFTPHPPIWSEEVAYHLWGCGNDDGWEKIDKLINDGLVTRRQRDDRLTMHSLVADYAAELFDQLFPPESEARKHVEQRYAACYVQYTGAKADEPVEGFYRRLDQEFTNLSKAVPWAIQSYPGESIEMLLRLRYYLEVRGHWKESRAWLQRTLDMVAGEQAVQITGQQSANLRLALSMACFKAGDFAAAESKLKEMLADELSLGDPFLLARLYYNLGMTLANQAKFDEPVEHLQQSLAAAGRMVDSGQKWRMLLMIYQQFGNCYLNGDTPSAYCQAREYLNQYLRLAEDWQFEDNRLLAYTYSYLGQAEYYLDHKDEARRYYLIAIRLARRVRDVENEALLLVSLAEVSLDLKKTARAGRYLARAEEICARYQISYLSEQIKENLRPRMDQG